ncbi:MAG: hypothetical protein ACFWT5_11600 [Pseudomonas helleri]
MSRGQLALLMLMFVTTLVLTWLVPPPVAPAICLQALQSLVFVTTSWVLIPRVLRAVLSPGTSRRPLEILSLPVLILATAAMVAPTLVVGMTAVMAMVVTVGMVIPVLMVSFLSIIQDH